MRPTLWSRILNQVEEIHNNASVSWTKARIRSLKMNVDAAHFFTNGSSACRGILRDPIMISWKFLFFCKISSSSSIFVEAWLFKALYIWRA